MSTDLFDLPAAAIKRYRQHGCRSQHRNYREWARCAWPSARLGSGEGPFATVARCRMGNLTVHLHPDLDSAHRWHDAIALPSGCGGVCTGHHELVEIIR